MSDHVLGPRDTDPRFGYPLDFVRKHVIGALAASRACCLLPGRRHLYHVTFEGRSPEFCEKALADNPRYSIDALLEAKFEVCDEVAWYLHRCAMDTPQQNPFAEFSKNTNVDTNRLPRAADLLATRPQCQPWCSAHGPHFGNCFIDKREDSRRNDAIPELSFKGTLGPAPAAYKNPEEVQ